jgi:hypothetical protein
MSVIFILSQITTWINGTLSQNPLSPSSQQNLFIWAEPVCHTRQFLCHTCSGLANRKVRASGMKKMCHKPHSYYVSPTGESME